MSKPKTCQRGWFYIKWIVFQAIDKTGEKASSKSSNTNDEMMKCKVTVNHSKNFCGVLCHINLPEVNIDVIIYSLLPNVASSLA